MADKDNAPGFGGFEVLKDTIGIGKVNSTTEGRTNLSDVTEGNKKDPTLITESDGNDPIVKLPGIDDNADDVDPNEDLEINDDEGNDDENDDDQSIDGDNEGDDEGDDDTGGEEGSEDDDNVDDSSDDKGDDGDTDLTKFEEDITGVFKEKLSDLLGWDFSKLEEEPKTVEDMVNFMNEIVTENSVPQYASDDIKALDDYVKNGGDIRKFYEETFHKGVDPESIDIEEEADQKKVVRQNLRNQGIKDSIIEKRLKRYEEAGVLAEEAEEALELVKEYEDNASKALLKEQEKQAELIEEQQQKFVSNVEESIDKLSDVKGMKISEKEKKELRDYILVTDAEGMTKYQREYMSDIKNLLESAYFTKNKDALLDRARKQGSSDSLKSLQKKLHENKGQGKTKKSQSKTNSVDLKSLGSKIGVI